MALEASHIRFALEIKDQLNVSDLCDYVLGSVYPDSRYVSGIDRKLTHPSREEILQIANKEQDDFYKGWFTHLLLDDIQYKIIQSSFPDLASNYDPGEKSDLWIKRTAIKILQDFDDVKQFDIGPSLKCLENQKYVNSEDVEKIKIYNKSIIELYADQNTDISSYEKLWKSWGLDEDTGNKLMAQVEEYKNNKEIVDKIKNNFTLILEEAKQVLPLSQN